MFEYLTMTGHLTDGELLVGDTILEILLNDLGKSGWRVHTFSRVESVMVQFVVVMERSNA